MSKWRKVVQFLRWMVAHAKMILWGNFALLCLTMGWLFYDVLGQTPASNNEFDAMGQGMALLFLLVVTPVVWLYLGLLGWGAVKLARKGYFVVPLVFTILSIVPGVSLAIALFVSTVFPHWKGL